MSHSEAKIARLLDQQSPRVLPSGWELREDYTNARIYWRTQPSFLSVIAEVAEYGGRLWLHVSCAARESDNTPKLPTWEIAQRAKIVTVGCREACLAVGKPIEDSGTEDPSS